MPVNPPQSNIYNPQPYYGNTGSMNRLSAMGAQAGSPYFQFTGRPNINQGDVLSALQQQFGTPYGGPNPGQGGMFPGLTTRGMYASGLSNNPWGLSSGGGGGYDPNASRYASSPWLDPNSSWYGNEGGYRQYRTANQGAATMGAEAGAAETQQRLDQLAHPGMTYDPFTKQWVLPGSRPQLNPVTGQYGTTAPTGRPVGPPVGAGR